MNIMIEDYPDGNIRLKIDPENTNLSEIIGLLERAKLSLWKYATINHEFKNIEEEST